jgi:uncharacterized protein (TIGR00369 family)
MDGIDIMKQFLPSSPFVGLVGIELKTLEDGYAELSLPFRDEVITIGQTVHGGAIASLIDCAAMAAAWAGAPVPENMRGTTVSISVSYLSAANGVDLVARAKVLRRGKNLSYIDVDVIAPDGEAIAKALVTYKIG